ncbi:O-antigen ligase family protein [Nonomuraea typhae]|uniref:O-antigen ligase family protein n=1 Tax=Nonomuraea typhae TaxID=2603600 RepID=UPI0012FBF10E|nr:O-antigen ligase family protein [Nonomuraea typhae]
MAIGFRPTGLPSLNGHRPTRVADLDGLFAGPRADGATVAILYVLILLTTPAALIVRGLPLSVTPAAIIGMIGLVLWLLTQMTSTLGAAKGRNVARTGLFLFFTANLVSYGYGTAHYLPSDEMNLADQNLFLLLANLGIGLLVCDGVRTMDRLNLLLKAAVVGGAVIGVIGAIQFTANFDITRYMVLPGLRLSWEDLYVFERGSVRRVASTTAHPIEFGVISAMLLPIAAHYAMRARTVGEPFLRWWACTALIGMGMMFSVSRSAVLSLIAIAAMLVTGWTWKRRLRALALLVGFLAVMRVAVPGLLGTFVDLFANFFTDSSIQYRTHDYDIAFAEIQRHLLLGRGTGTWYFPKYQVFDNQYMQTAIDLGLIGVVIFLLMMASGIVAGIWARKLSADPHIRDLGLTLAAVMLAPIVSAATFDMLAFATVTGLMFVLIGACGALLRVARQEKAGREKAQSPAHSSGPVTDVTR